MRAPLYDQLIVLLIELIGSNEFSMADNTPVILECHYFRDKLFRKPLEREEVSVYDAIISSFTTVSAPDNPQQNHKYFKSIKIH